MGWGEGDKSSHFRQLNVALRRRIVCPGC